MTHYDVLEVAPTASAREVRQAYLAQARRHHPDRAGVDDPGALAAHDDAMRAVNEAWRVLGDPERRRAYDRDVLDEVAPRPFVAFDDSPDEVDPRDLVPDEPYRPRTARQQARFRFGALIPVALASAAVVLWMLGVVFSSSALMSIAFLVFVLAGMGVAAVALVALAQARSDEGPVTHR